MKLATYGGSGYEYCDENGEFEVRYSGGTKKFAKLSDAINFYEPLCEESSLWNVGGIPELLDGKIFES